MRRMREDVNKETHSNALGVSVQECECCGHPKHGLYCDTRTEMSNGAMDICLCDAGYVKRFGD